MECCGNVRNVLDAGSSRGSDDGHIDTLVKLRLRNEIHVPAIPINSEFITKNVATTKALAPSDFYLETASFIWRQRVLFGDSEFYLATASFAAASINAP